MTTASIKAAPGFVGIPFRRSRTIRGFLCTVLAMVLLVGGLSLLAPLEQAIFGAAHLAGRPFASAMQIVGLPHVLIGFLFMATSVKMRNVRSRLAIGAMLLVGALLCGLFYLAGGPNAHPRLPMAFLAAYFLVHAYRDELFFYQRYGEEKPRTDRRHLPLLLVALFVSLLALAWSWAMSGGIESREFRALVDLRTLQPGQRLALWLAPCAALCALAWACVRAALRRSGRSLRELLAEDKPLWFVYLGVPLVVFVCGPWGGQFYALVLLHVIGWWIFASLSFASAGRKPAPARGVWTWMRTTQRGFQTLHGASSLAVLVLLLCYFHSQTPLQDTAWSWVLDRDAFYYWTVMHVTVSFVPKG